MQGVGDLTVGATIHALRAVKGASTIPADQQVLGGSIENYRSNLLLSMIGSGTHKALGGNPNNGAGWIASITEQQMIMFELSGGSTDAEADIKALAGMRMFLLWLNWMFMGFLQNSARQLCTTLQSHSWQSARTTVVGMLPSCVNCGNDSTLELVAWRKLTQSPQTSWMEKLLILHLIGWAIRYVEATSYPPVTHKINRLFKNCLRSAPLVLAWPCSIVSPPTSL